MTPSPARHSHIQISIRTDPSAFDNLVGLMNAEKFEGFWEDGDILRAYLRDDEFTEGLVESLKERLTHATESVGLPPPTIAVERIQEQDWNAQWEATITPIRASKHFVIAPTWAPFLPGPGDIVLRIDPKMAFGTGYHESTRLVLRFLEKYCRPESRVLDVGTGTGILAIAAAKLGAANIIALDRDPWAVDNALENVKANLVRDRVEIRFGGLEVVTEREFDLIAANIHTDVIAAMMNEFVVRMRGGARLLLSGLLREDQHQMIEVVQKFNLKVVDTASENEWVALAIGSSGPSS
jgi:ribosomal protein L11 methyltransferase